MTAAANRPVSTVVYAEDLVRRIRANEPDAFEELYARYSPRVFGYLYQRLNGNHEEAEDLTAEVFAKVYEKIDGYQVQGAPLSSWLFRIAHNRLIDSVRRRPRQTQVGLDLAPGCRPGRFSRASTRRWLWSRSKSAWRA
jgi:RNA polymerase sigma-70 factor (ECF subfamily)